MIIKIMRFKDAVSSNTEIFEIELWLDRDCFVINEDKNLKR